LRLRLLQGQLEPSFLSGSLTAIGKLIRTQQRDSATRALARLSDLLRYALRASRSDSQSVADEVQFMRDYVDMRGICHGKALPVQWQLEQCDWADVPCPPLLLFPMLEQAIDVCLAGGTLLHGITVSIVRGREADAGRLQVEVRHAHRAAGGRDATPADLRERLAMLYGGDATLETKVEGDATHMRLGFPVARHDD
jgi:two-component system, LytTR family, sensor histidine kinase AlgZ